MQVSFGKSLLRLVDDKTIHSVFGYMRDQSRRLLTENNNLAFYNVPELITLICLQYFYVKERFQNPQADCMLSMNRQYMQSLASNSWTSAFGKQVIPSLSANYKVTWNLRLSMEHTGSYYIVGITSNPSLADVPFQQNKQDANYAYYIQSNQAFCKYTSKPYGAFGSVMANADALLVRMELDMKADTLSFEVRNSKRWFRSKQNMSVMYGNIERRQGVDYCLALSLYGPHACASVESFSVE